MRLGDEDDRELVAGVAARDRRAMAQLYRLYGPAMLCHARAALASADVAEDVVQDVFLRFWYNPARFDSGRGSLRGYLIMETRSRALDHYRSETALRRRQDRWSHELRSEAPVEHQVLGQLDAGAIRAMLTALPANERIAIELAFFGANTYRQIAQLLDEPEGTIKSRIRAGLRRLRAPALATIRPTDFRSNAPSTEGRAS